jgi:short-subunit dehydrogenase
MDIAGTTAIVTGASSGIGAATARALVARGASVILLARRRDRLMNVADDIRRAGGKAEVHPVDLGNPAAVVACAKAILAGSGAPHILVNNAGAGRWLSLLETDAQELEGTMALPYFAAFNLTRELLPAMLARGNAHIVNVTSVGSRLVWPGAAAYIAARRAMEGFNDALRIELASTNIHVTLAMFGSVETEYWTSNPGSRERLPRMPVRFLSADEAAAAIVSGIENNRRLVLKPGIFHLLIFLNTLFPRTTEGLMRRTGWQGSRAG